MPAGGLASTLNLQAASFATQMKLEPAERLALFKSALTWPGSKGQGPE